MQFIRKHWYDLGGFLALLCCIYLYVNRHALSPYSFLMWASFISLCLHQWEEYRFPGTFPGMLNKVMFKSDIPDRYPLNTNTAFIINTGLGWLFYLMAALLAEKAVWLGLATILVSAGNVGAHIFLFNIKGKTIYNAGMATALFLFLPLVFYFFYVLHKYDLASTDDIWIGGLLGVLLNTIGIFKLIDWLKDTNTSYVFEKRNVK